MEPQRLCSFFGRRSRRRRPVVWALKSGDETGMRGWFRFPTTIRSRLERRLLITRTASDGVCLLARAKLPRLAVAGAEPMLQPARDWAALEQLDSVKNTVCTDTDGSLARPPVRLKDLY